MPTKTLKRVVNGDLPVGPDKYYGGDQLAWEFNIGFKHSKLFKLARVA